MRRHARSGATMLVALSLAAIGCGEKTPSAPIIGSEGHEPPPATSQVALTKQADTLVVDDWVQLHALIPAAPGTVAPTVTWSSSDPSVGIVAQNGVLFALKSGGTTITVTAGGRSDATTVTVKPSVREVSFGSDSLAISLSQSVKLPYRVMDSDGNPVDLSTHTVEWTTSDPDVVPLTGDATVTGRAIGSSALLLRVDNKQATTTVKVMSKPIASVVVSPTSLNVGVTQSATINATLYDINGTVITNRNLTWNTSDATIAYVSPNGVVTGVANGQATITVNAQGRKATIPVTVGAAPTNPGVSVASVAVSLSPSTVTAGQTAQATATTKDANGNVLTGRTIVWSTSDPTIASPDGLGVISAIKAGTVTITATSEGKTGSAGLTIAPPTTAPTPVASMTISVSSSLNIGQQVQATATLKDASGNVLTGRTVNWVSSDASIVSVSSTGLVTALKGGGVTITASVDGGVSASAVVSAIAPVAARTMTISAGATELAVGEFTQITAVVRDASGNVVSVPVTFSSTPTTVATVTGSGMAAGVSAGSATIYAKADTVVRSVGLSVIAAPAPPPPSTGTTTPPPPGTGTLNAVATMAALPQATVSTTYPTPARQVRVAAGSNLQTAIDAAQPGDELLLAPGATFVGNFTLPNKGTSTSWITIRTDVSDATIGSAGTRMTPSRASSARLAKILTPNTMGAIATDLSAHHWRLTGLELGGTTAAQEISGIVRFGDGSGAQNSLSLVAHHLVLDRSFVHGLSTQAVRRCISLQSATTAIVDSWISDCHSNNGDSQGIVGWNGPGPYLIGNNHIEGGHQGLFFGGADPAITNLSPSDITVIGNHITRPTSWRGVWQTKTIIETKNARRMLLEGNVIENVWPDAQTGFALLLKSENQNGTAPWSQSTDITVRNNRIRNVAAGFNLASNPGQYPVVLAARMTIVDNIIDNLGQPYGGVGIPIQFLGALTDIVVAHNSFSNAVNQAISFDGGVTSRVVIHSNVIPSGVYGVKGSGTGTGTATLTAYAPNGVFSYVEMINANCNSYPATTICPSVIPSSLPAGYDGQTIGANVSTVTSATSSVLVGP
jgi:uncharacterized protein YjdB